jgi:hypothetical protein
VRVIAGVGVCAALLLAAAPAQADNAKGSTTCRYAIERKEITGNLTVPPGTNFHNHEQYVLYLDIVDGNVFVDQGSEFIA